MKKRSQGFTLIELLIALVILAIIGAMMMVGLRSAIRTENRISVHAARLAAVQSAVLIMERDIEQVINRPIIGTNGIPAPAIVLTNADKQQTLEFTHAGLVNPFSAINRTTMERVAYTWDGNALIRLSWDVLDRVADSSPESQVLLQDVSDFHVNLYYKTTSDSNNAAQEPMQILQQTPVIQTTANVSAQSLPLPAAVEVTLVVDGIGTVTRLIPLPG